MRDIYGELYGPADKKVIKIKRQISINLLKNENHQEALQELLETEVHLNIKGNGDQLLRGVLRGRGKDPEDHRHHIHTHSTVCGGPEVSSEGLEDIRGEWHEEGCYGDQGETRTFQRHQEPTELTNININHSNIYVL